MEDDNLWALGNGDKLLRRPQTPILFAAPDCGETEIDAIANVIRSRWIVGGTKLQKLETMFQDRTGARHAIGVSSWTTGAFLTLHAMGIGPGDEVLAPSLSFIATVNVVRHVGATPIFVDIDPHTWNLDPRDVEAKITRRTKAIIPVDQIGLPCEMDALNEIAERHRLHVIQDAACALGSVYNDREVGASAEVAIFSLHARKIVTTGEGGMIVTNDDDIAQQLRLLRHQGMSITDVDRHGGPSTNFEEYPVVGFNFRLTDIQAAMGIPQMERLDATLATRRRLGNNYQSAFADALGVITPAVLQGCQPNWQSYMIRVNPHVSRCRNEVMEMLDASGIPTRRGIMASHREAPYAGVEASLPITEAITDSTILLPMHNDLSTDQQAYIIYNVLQLLG